MGDLHIGFYKLGFATNAIPGVVQPHIALLQINDRVVEKYLRFLVRIESKQVGNPVELRLHVLQGFLGEFSPFSVKIDIEILRTQVFPVEILVLNPVTSKRLISTLCRNT